MEFLVTRKKTSRRNYLQKLLGGAIGISLVGFFGYRKRPKTVKMLSQEGKLVEVPLDKLPANSRKASTREMKSWIWKHNT